MRLLIEVIAAILLVCCVASPAQLPPARWAAAPTG